ncbi:hypothetical protein RB195_005290 [Necator americanus]|uniref:Uncharacterized protein n=1 Tax=Necator americanus TaxID=51031 RepID=A0ABR1BM38_NECAM
MYSLVIQDCRGRTTGLLASKEKDELDILSRDLHNRVSSSQYARAVEPPIQAPGAHDVSLKMCTARHNLDGSQHASYSPILTVSGRSRPSFSQKPNHDSRRKMHRCHQPTSDVSRTLRVLPYENRCKASLLVTTSRVTLHTGGQLTS